MFDLSLKTQKTLQHQIYRVFTFIKFLVSILN